MAKIFILWRRLLRSGEVKNAMTEKIKTGAKKNKPRDGEKSRRKKFDGDGIPMPKTPCPATSAHSGKLSCAYENENGEPNSALL